MRSSLKLFPDTVENHKKYDCKFYEKCLDTASENNWPQFHCRSCKAYEKEEIVPDVSGFSIILDE